MSACLYVRMSVSLVGVPVALAGPICDKNGLISYSGKINGEKYLLGLDMKSVLLL